MKEFQTCIRCSKPYNWAEIIFDTKRKKNITEYVITGLCEDCRQIMRTHGFSSTEFSDLYEKHLQTI